MFWLPLHTTFAVILGHEAFRHSSSIILSVIGCNYGSSSTSLTILKNILASKSIKILCRMIKKPPFLQLSACVTMYFSPQGNIAGKPFRGLLYLKFRAYLYPPLSRVKTNFFKSTTASHKDAQGMLASFIAFNVWRVWSCYTFKARSEMVTSCSFFIFRLISFTSVLVESLLPCIIKVVRRDSVTTCDASNWDSVISDNIRISNKPWRNRSE